MSTKYQVLRRLPVHGEDPAAVYAPVQVVAAHGSDAACRIVAAELKLGGAAPPFDLVAVPLRSFQVVTFDERPAQLQIVRST